MTARMSEQPENTNLLSEFLQLRVSGALDHFSDDRIGTRREAGMNRTCGAMRFATEEGIAMIVERAPRGSGRKQHDIATSAVALITPGVCKFSLLLFLRLISGDQEVGKVTETER